MALLSPNQLLHLGPDPSSSVGWNHFDLGLGLSSHINYAQSALGNTPPQGAPWWYSKTNSAGLPVVQFSAPLNGATTSTNTKYARCELREYERNGTTKMAFDPRSGDHWIEGIYRITGLSPDKSGVCVQQAHDPNDDVIMVRTEGSSGSVGMYLNYNGTRVATLTSNYVIGTEFYLKIRVNAGTPSVYYSTNVTTFPTTPFHTSAGYFSGAATGWYFKSGCYNQSNETTDTGSDPDAAVIKVEVRELKHWHSQTPAGGAWPTPAVYTAASTATVNAGADASIANTGTFSRTATVTLNGATLTSQEWKILSGPDGVGSLLSTGAAVNWNPSGAGLPNGSYVLQFTANTSSGPAIDTVTVTVTAVGGGGIAAYPAFVSVGAVASSDGSGTVTVGAPPGVTNKMFQICIIQDPTEESITAVPAGWALLDDIGVDNVDVNGPAAGPSHAFIYYNTTGDSASRSWSKDGTRGYHAIRMAWKDWSALGEHLTRGSGFTTTPYSATVDPLTNQALVVSVMASDRKDVTAGPVTVPNGWTQRYNAGVTVNGNEIEWISVADIQATNKAATGGNVPDGTGTATSNFLLTNADNCSLFSFVLEGVTVSGVTVSGAVNLTAGKNLTVGAPPSPVGAGGVVLAATPTLQVRALLRGLINLTVSSVLGLNSAVFPRTSLTAIPTLTFNSTGVNLFQTGGIQLLIASVLRSGALPYRRPVLRTDYVYPPKNHPFRLIAQRILDGEIVEWELPVDNDFEYVEQLSGPTVMQGTFKPEMIQVQELNLDGYAYWLHVEINEQIRASAIFLPPQYEDTGMTFSAEGISAAPHYHTYDNVFQQIQIDPLSIVRTIWNYVQSQPQSDLGVVVSNNSSPVRLGEAAIPATPDMEDKIATAKWILEKVKGGADWTSGAEGGWPESTFPNTPDIVRVWSNNLLSQAVQEITGPRGQATYTAWLTDYIDDHEDEVRDVEAKPYELVWWNATNCGEEIDTLSGQTPFDYVERHEWNSNRTDVLHYFDMGYPRIGKAQPNLLFNEENILEVVPMQEDEDSYASAVLVIGAGDGEDTIRGYAAQAFGDRVRKEVVITDKSITDQARANARALTELAIRRGRTFEIAEIVVAAYHTYAPIGSYRVGDDIQVSVDIPWLMETHVAWYRITSISNKPSSDKVRLGLSHAGVFDYSESISNTPTTGDEYLPFEPPVTGPTSFPGNIFLRITMFLSNTSTQILPAVGATVLTATASLSASGAVSRTGAVSLVVGKTLAVSGIAAAPTSSTVSMTVNKTLSVSGASTQPGAVSLNSTATLTTNATAVRVAAVSLTTAQSLIAAAGTVLGAVTMIASSTLTTDASVPRGAVSLSIGKTLTVGAFGGVPAAVSLVTTQSLTSQGVGFFSGAINLSVGKTLTASGISSGVTTTVDASVAQRTTGANNTALATHTITKPAGVTSSQGILVCFTNDVATVGADTTSTGWVKLGTQSQGATTNHTGTVFWAANAATASDLVVNLTTTATGVTASEEATWGVVVVESPGTPEIIGANGSGLNPAVPTLTTAGTGDYLSVVYIGVDSSTDTTFTQTVTPPTSYTNLQSRNPTVTSSAATFTMERLYTAVSSIAPGSATLSLTEQWVAFNICFPGVATTGAGGGGGTGVAFNAVGPTGGLGQAGTDTTAISWSHTCTGTNRYVTVGIQLGNPSDARTVAVTYGGVAMTPIKLQRSNNATGGYVQLFGLVNPPTGAQTISVAVTGGIVQTLIGGSISFVGVDQSTPIGTPVTAVADSTSCSVVVPNTTAGNMVVDAVCHGGGLSTSGKTLRWKRNVNGFNAAGNGAQATHATTGGSVTMSYTATVQDYFGLVAVEIKAAP